MHHTTDIAIERSIVVAAPRARAFEVFVNMSAWWPLATHTLGAKPGRASIVEPRAGGRWYDVDADGTECPVGRVVTYEPPERIVLTWEVGCGFEHDPARPTFIEARFVAETPERTRVDLVHRGLQAYGERAEEMRALYEGDDAWTYVWECYRKAAGSP